MATLPSLVDEILATADVDAAVGLAQALQDNHELKLALSALERATTVALGGTAEDGRNGRLSRAWRALGREVAERDLEGARVVFERSLEVVPHDQQEEFRQRQAEVQYDLAELHL